MSKKEKNILQAEKLIEVRFSEVDSMGIVWHGSYPLYLEEARETFGKKYELSYMQMFDRGFYTPLVEMSVKYKQPIRYEDTIRVVAKYKNTEAAKIVFDYEIYHAERNTLMATATTTQVFLNKDFELLWQNPNFYNEWKQKWDLL